MTSLQTTSLRTVARPSRPFLRRPRPRSLLLACFVLLLLSPQEGLLALEKEPDGTWSVTDPKALGWSQRGLERAAKYAKGQQSSGLVVVVDGNKILDQSWELKQKKGRKSPLLREPVDGRAVEDVASVQKSVTAFLIGMAEKRKLVEIDASVSQLIGDGWSKAGKKEKDITVRHLLTMTSGLTRELTRETEPGAKWRYNTRAYANLRDVLEKVTGRSIEDVTRQWLTGPLGMGHTQWRSRGFGSRVISKLGLSTTAEDLARFGGLVLDQAVLNGERLVTEEYFEAMLSPSQAHNSAYGYLWWINGQKSGLHSNGRRVPGPLIPTAPDDLVAAMGALDRRVYVVPSLGMVVTRTGAKAEAKDFDERLWELLLSAAPLDSAAD